MYILLYGSDTFRSRRKLKEMQGVFIAKRDPSGLNVAVFDAAAAVDQGDMMSAAAAAPFLADRRLVIIENLLQESEKGVLDTWLQFLKSRVGDNNAVIFWEEAVKKDHPLPDFLKEQPYSQEFEILEGAKLIDWINKGAQSLGLTIEPAASRYLAAQSGGDLWRLSNELNKIVAVTLARGKSVIGVSDLSGFADGRLEEDVFNFVEALVNRRAKEALGLLHNLWFQGVSEAEVFGAVIWQVKTLLVVKNYSESSPVASGAAKDLGLPPFVVKKSLALASRFSFAKLKAIYKFLLDLDIQVKTSQAPAATLFDLLVAKVSAI